MVAFGQNIEFCGRADRNISRSIEIGRGQNWSKHKFFGRSGRNVSSLVAFGQNIEFCGRANRNISRSIKLGRNIDFLVVPIDTYLAWSNLVET